MAFISFRFLTTIDVLRYFTPRKVCKDVKISKHRQPCMNCNVVSGQSKHISFHLINNKLHTTTSGCFLLALHWHWFNCDLGRSCFLSERFIRHLWTFISTMKCGQFNFSNKRLFVSNKTSLKVHDLNQDILFLNRAAKSSVIFWV